MTTRSKEELLVEIPQWMKHFDDEDGGYTYEFSIHIDDLKETFDMLNSFHSNVLIGLQQLVKLVKDTMEKDLFILN